VVAARADRVIHQQCVGVGRAIRLYNQRRFLIK
jgi:hypothetical protein